VGRCVGLEPSARLLELALAADPVAAAGLVPRDGHVDEPLQEVALRLRGRAPRELEVLVGLEVRPRDDQLEASLIAHGTILAARTAGATLAAMVTILLAGVDLFFRGKLEALLPGYHLVTTDSIDAPDLVIVDISRVDPDEVVDAWPDIPIVGFTNHTDKSGLQRAHTAGFDQVLVKSALVERCPEVVAELVGTPR
jgi:CheY-like chemotaxis protein